MTRCFMHVEDKDIAESMWYTLDRWDKKLRKNVPIVGPSIRLAEILASQWCNLHIMTRVTNVTSSDVTAISLVMDLETNTTTVGEETVPILGSASDNVKLARGRASAYAYRNGVFKAVPKVYQKSLLAHAHQVFTAGDIGPRQVAMMEWFAYRHVGEDAVLSAVDKVDVGDLTNEDLINLRGMANRIVGESKSAGTVMHDRQEDAAHQEAAAATEAPEDAPPASMQSLADAAGVNALEMDAKKKFKTKFKRVWDAASAIANGDQEVLRDILSAQVAIVSAALVDDDPGEALLQIAKAAKLTRVAEMGQST